MELPRRAVQPRGLAGRPLPRARRRTNARPDPACRKDAETQTPRSSARADVAHGGRGARQASLPARRRHANCEAAKVRGACPSAAHRSSDASDACARVSGLPSGRPRHPGQRGRALPRRCVRRRASCLVSTRPVDRGASRGGPRPRGGVCPGSIIGALRTATVDVLQPGCTLRANAARHVRRRHGSVPAWRWHARTCPGTCVSGSARPCAAGCAFARRRARPGVSPAGAGDALWRNDESRATTGVELRHERVFACRTYRSRSSRSMSERISMVFCLSVRR